MRNNILLIKIKMTIFDLFNVAFKKFKKFHERF